MSSWKLHYLYGVWSLASLLYYTDCYHATVCWKLYDCLFTTPVTQSSSPGSRPHNEQQWKHFFVRVYIWGKTNQLFYSSNPKSWPGLSYQPPTKLSARASSAHQGLIWIKIKGCEVKVAEMVYGHKKQRGSARTVAGRKEKRQGTHRFPSVCALALLLSPWEQTCCGMASELLCSNATCWPSCTHTHTPIIKQINMMGFFSCCFPGTDIACAARCCI